MSPAELLTRVTEEYLKTGQNEELMDQTVKAVAVEYECG